EFPGRWWMVVTLLLRSVLVVALAWGVMTYDNPARAGGIGDIISDFLHYQEELKVKAPARPVADVLTSMGERYLGLIEADGAVRVWDFETGGQVMVDGRRPANARAIFPNARGANLIVAESDGHVYETKGMSFTAKATLLPAPASADAVAVSTRAPVL